MDRLSLRRSTSGSPATTSRSTGIRIVATPGHTPGHQSLAVETDRGLVVLAGQAVYTVDEWVGTPDELEGRTSAPDRDAYDRSTAHLHALDPDAASTSAMTGGPGDEPTPEVGRRHPGYHSRAVLGGELAVPCTCNPL